MQVLLRKVGNGLSPDFLADMSLHLSQLSDEMVCHQGVCASQLNATFTL